MNPKNKVFIGMVGASLLASISLWEGEKTIPYLDVTGTPTVCSGITENVDMKKVYTKAECDKLNSEAIAEHGKGILKCINVPINYNEYKAYTMFGYNVGVANACSSAAIKALNKGDHTLACIRLYKNELGQPAWSYSNGKYFQGLQNRRQYESKLCLTPV